MNLKAAREHAGLTQAQVANKALISERVYQNYEYSKNEPNVRTAIKIAKALGSTVEKLFQVQEKGCANSPNPAQKG